VTRRLLYRTASHRKRGFRPSRQGPFGIVHEPRIQFGSGSPSPAMIGDARDITTGHADKLRLADREGKSWRIMISTGK
jgi:hypothetical protein